MENKKMILDVCCGSKMFWFDKHQENTIYMDNRDEEYDVYDKHVAVHPDIIGDFRNIPFEDNQFNLVVFDPPHLRWAGQKSIMRSQYGQLSKDWEYDLKRGFDECMRVLKHGGVLVFKWNETQIDLKKILSVLNAEPLFGHKSGKAAKTHWICFMKLEE